MHDIHHNLYSLLETAFLINFFINNKNIIDNIYGINI